LHASRRIQTGDKRRRKSEDSGERRIQGAVARSHFLLQQDGILRFAQWNVSSSRRQFELRQQRRYLDVLAVYRVAEAVEFWQLFLICDAQSASIRLICPPPIASGRFAPSDVRWSTSAPGRARTTASPARASMKPSILTTT